MENKNRGSNTLWSSHCKSHQSQWLQTTLSDLDEKIMAMITIIQEENYSSIHRDEMYQKKTQELIKMGEEFHKSCLLFAEGYGQLSSESSEPIQSESLSTNNSVDAKPEPVVEGPALEFDDSKFDPELPNDSIDYQSPTEESNPILKSKKETRDTQVAEGKREVIRIAEVNKNNGACLGSNSRGTTEDFSMGSFEREGMWYELSFQVSKLIGENQRQQAELISRNEAKRETIKDLYCQIDRLMNENKVLHDQLRCSEHGVNKNQSQLSKLKRLILGRFLRGDTP